jgi:hypothetical protein
MERITGPVAGMKVEAWASRRDDGWVAGARVVQAEPPGDVVVRVGTGPLPDEQQALAAVERKAQEAILRRLIESKAG